MPWGLSTAAYFAIASAVVTAAGTYESSQAAAGAAKYNASVAEQNAQIATQNAQLAAGEGEQKTGLAGLQAQATSGKIKAAEAADNVDVDSGSSLGVQKSSAEAGMLNEMNIRSNAARTAYGYEVNNVQDIGQANLDRAQATSDEIGGYLSASGKLIGAAGDAAGGIGGAAGSVGSGDSNSVVDLSNSSYTGANQAFLGGTPSSNWLGSQLNATGNF